MRPLIATAALLGCTATPPPIAPPPIANHAPAAAPVARSLPLDAAHWQLAASARFTAGGIELRYCCTNHGEAATTLALPAGTYWIGVEHAGDCARALAAIVTAGDERLALGGVWSERVGIVQLRVDAAHAHVPLRLRILAEGGLHCCGASTLASLDVMPIAP